jgi:hypothetical protein
MLAKSTNGKCTTMVYIYIYTCFGWLVVLSTNILGGVLIEHLKTPCFWFFSPNKRKEKTPKDPATLYLCGVF